MKLIIIIYNIFFFFNFLEMIILYFGIYFFCIFFSKYIYSVIDFKIKSRLYISIYDGGKRGRSWKF